MLKEHTICKVQPCSIAEELELEPGDVLLSVNGHEIEDVFDYKYFTNEEYLTVLVRKGTGEEWELEIEKEYEDDLGIEFENGLMDEYKSCRNKCIFCFIDQMPKGMRDTLYFKDDDSRLSFLQGNYVTLTNMGERDLERIVAYRLGPINISVQATDPALRCKILNNRFAGEALKKMDVLHQAGIPMNGQIVLCKGVNDGEQLKKSITDLMGYMPVMESVSIVPVGLSKYREGLYPLEPFTKEDAKEVLGLVHQFQKTCFETCGLHFVHASDEWYLLAGQELPGEEIYDGYPQLENGVGMLRLLREEFAAALGEAVAESSGPGGFGGLARAEKITIATGVLAAPTLQELADAFQREFPQKEIQVISITNQFFGEQITVSGLLTGQDLAGQLKNRDLGSRLLLPCSLLRSGEEVFLDDITLSQLKNALQVEIDIVKSSGQDLVSCLIGGADQVLCRAGREKLGE
jgi:putative radical SAM enzyme (TIGR03279 family)